MQTTDPPVKVLLADGIHEVGASTMKQLPLIYFLPPVLLLHLAFLPGIAETYMLREEGADLQRTVSSTHFLKQYHVTRRGCPGQLLEAQATEHR